MSLPESTDSGSGKKLDDLFRDALSKQEFTPSPRVWRAVNLKLLLSELMRLNFSNLPKLALVSVSGGILLLASLAYMALKPDVKDPVPVNNSSAAPAIAAQSGLAISPSKADLKPAQATGKQTLTINSGTSTLVKKEAALQRGHKADKGSLIASNTRIEKAASFAEPSSAPVLKNSMAASLPVSAENSVNTDKQSDVYLSVEYLDPLVFSNFELLPAVDTLSFIRSGDVYKYVREPMPVSSFFSLSGGIAPEMALYRSGGTTRQESNYWANAGIAYHFSRFSVHTGLGIGYTYDEGSYRLEYCSNDSVSYYKEVTGYYTDPSDPSRIIYITRDKAIYDSVTHIADDRTRNRYTYLQIPLLLGYNLLETSRFSLGIEAGPAFAFLINEKKAQPVVNIPGGRLVELSDNSPARVSSNWQLWVKLSIGYQFTKNWGLTVNPYYKYYLTSPSQSAESGKPSTQAIGVDIGIQYLFGRKSNKK